MTNKDMDDIGAALITIVVGIVIVTVTVAIRFAVVAGTIVVAWLTLRWLGVLA